MTAPIKVIDLFAGPGGLGEGFSSLISEGISRFKIAVSVEKESSAHKTLTLRAFFRQFPADEVPEEYYDYLRGEISKEVLFETWPDQAYQASIETLGGPTALGEDNSKIDIAINNAIADQNQPWVLIGGPPCQAYSLVGRARNKGKSGYVPEEDHRNFLYEEYLRILAKYEPPVFVMENVKGMLSSRVNGKQIFQTIMSDLRSPSAHGGSAPGGAQYRIFSLSTKAPDDLFDPTLKPADFVLKAEEFGIPQTRHRVILLGIREDIDINDKTLVLDRDPAPDLKSIIGVMPMLRSGLSKEIDSPERWMNALNSIEEETFKEFNSDSEHEDLLRKITSASKNRSLPLADRGARFLKFRANSDPYAQMPKQFANWFKDEKLTGYVNHESRGHIRHDLGRYLFCAAYAQRKHYSKGYKSPKISEFPEFLQPAHANRSSGKFADRFRVQLPHGPASTVTCHISKDGHYYIHYDLKQCRSLTVREAARIQTFPDNYFFEGNRTQQYVQVGNAVPPLLAKQIAEIVLGLLD